MAIWLQTTAARRPPSAALRRGSTETGPIKHIALIVRPTEPGSVEDKVLCCALGAMAVGYTGLPEGEDLRLIKEESHSLGSGITYPWHTLLLEAGVPLDDTYTHPETGAHDSLGNIIIDLFDCREWSRERIADWLEEQGL